MIPAAMFDKQAALRLDESHRPGYQGGRRPEDNNLRVRFYVDGVQNNIKSADVGRPVFEDREFVSILTPGDKTEVVKEVDDAVMKRFPSEYRQWKEHKSNPVAGSPLAEWPMMTTSIVRELEGVGCYTVEQLASAEDGFLDQLGMGGRGLQQKAKDYLDRAQGGADTTKLQEQVRELETANRILRDHIAKLDEQFGHGEKKHHKEK